MLTDSFMAGHVSLSVLPDPRLLAMENPYQFETPHRLHDASLYKGRYYVYFGPTPVLVLLLPFLALTGHHLPSQVAVAIFCSAGFLFSLGFFYTLKRIRRWSLSLWLEILIVLCLGNTGPVCHLLGRPLFYETAIAAAYCFLMAGLFFLLRALGEPLKLPNLTAAGVCFGLVMGCRFHIALVSAVMIVFVGLHLLRTRDRRLVLSLAAFVLPIAVSGSALAVYNYERFDSPFETGVRYQLTSAPRADGTNGVEVNFATFLPTMKGFLLQPPHIDSIYPYVHLVYISPFPGFQIPDTYEPMAGLLFTTPVVIPGFLSFWLLRKKPPDLGVRFVRVLSLCGILILCVLSLIAAIIARYLMDFAPLLIMASCCTLVILWNSDTVRLKKWSQGAFAAAVAWSILFNCAVESPKHDAMQRILGGLLKH